MVPLPPGPIWLPFLFPLSILHPFLYICFPLHTSVTHVSTRTQCLILSEEQPSKVIHSRAVSSSRKGHFRGGCLYITKSANAECEVTSGSLLLGLKLVCWHSGQTQPTLGLCFPCLSEAAVHATRQPRPHKPWSIAPPTLMFQLIAGLSRTVFS